MQRIWEFFRIRREERWPVAVVMVVLIILNALSIHRFAPLLSPLRKEYHWTFVHGFQVSGFDPLTYVTVSHWGMYYEVFRHPLLAYFMYLPYAANRLLMVITGMNCVQWVMAVLLVLTGVYTFVFLFRIFRDLVGLTYPDALLLTALQGSFAYVMLSLMVPDHFGFSMCLLILTVYVTGREMKRGTPLKVWEMVVLFGLTAGISLSNGLKVFLAGLFANGKRFFSPRYLLGAVLLPALLMWAVALLENRWMVVPEETAHQQRIERFQKKADERAVRKFRDTTALKDPGEVDAGIRALLHARQEARSRSAVAGDRHSGQPMKKEGFWKWTDETTSRTETVVENLFGESIALHPQHLLEDVLTTRPVVVPYQSWTNYLAEGVFCALLLMGLWYGRRSRLMWMAVSFFALDMGLHLGLGFGINEIYIMSPHWLFVFPIVLSCLFRSLKGPRLQAVRGVTCGLAAFWGVSNLYWIFSYFL